MLNSPTLGVCPLNDANRLGLNFHHEAARLPYQGVIHDTHLHIHGLTSALEFMPVAERYGIHRFWPQSPLEDVDVLKERFPGRFEFIATPNYSDRTDPNRFGVNWLRRIEAYRAKGAKMTKFWAAPRGRDLHESFFLDHPTRIEAMKLSRSLGMGFVTHVADPDTWFATHYKNVNRYGTKRSHYEPLRRLLEEFHDVPWLAAHMGGDPEHLDHLQELLDLYPHLHLDTSATKWQVRELSKHPAELRAFCQRNPGRILFGTDNVVSPTPPPSLNPGPTIEPTAFDLYASRYWALRALFETDYEGPSPIVDPDLRLVDPTQSATATPMMAGAKIDPTTLSMMYQHAAEAFLKKIPANG